MGELSDLYQELILDHNRTPRNFGKLADANRSAEGFNPLCGDKLNLSVKVENGVIRDIAFQGSGCAISKASASMMTEGVKGKTQKEAEAIFEKFHSLVTGKPIEGGPELGKLEAFAGVSEFPVRVKCASLPWHTLRAALENQKGAVSTE